jgi:hypothetical protein
MDEGNTNDGQPKLTDKITETFLSLLLKKDIDIDSIDSIDTDINVDWLYYLRFWNMVDTSILHYYFIS